VAIVVMSATIGAVVVSTSLLLSVGSDVFTSFVAATPVTSMLEIGSELVLEEDDRIF